jgi:hypothetical protein
MRSSVLHRNHLHSGRRETPKEGTLRRFVVEKGEQKLEKVTQTGCRDMKEAHLWRGKEKGVGYEIGC